MTRIHDDDDQSNLALGFAASLIGHALVFALCFLHADIFPDFGALPVYSVTLEGGNVLGGISQVPKDQKSQQMAPPKAASEEEKSEEKKTAKKEPENKTKEKETPPDKNDLIIPSEKKKDEIKKDEKKDKPKKVDKTSEKIDPKKEEKKKKEAELKAVDEAYQKAMQRYTGESNDAGGGKQFGAASLGGKGMGGGVIMPAIAKQYSDWLQSFIKKNWVWYDNSQTLIAYAEFELSASGEITNVRIISASGRKEYDESVTRAIIKSSPLPYPPPEQYYQMYFRKVKISFSPQDI